MLLNTESHEMKRRDVPSVHIAFRISYAARAMIQDIERGFVLEHDGTKEKLGLQIIRRLLSRKKPSLWS